jgi:hypothetical protein
MSRGQLEVAPPAVGATLDSPIEDLMGSASYTSAELAYFTQSKVGLEKKEATLTFWSKSSRKSGIS